MRRNSKKLKSLKLGAGGRLGAMLFAAVFALAFGAGGVWGGLLPLYDTFRAKVDVQDWVQVPAQIRDSRLSSRRGDDSTVYRAEIRYQYVFNGRRYESRRVGLATDAGSDNIGDWHQKWVRKAERAKANGHSLTAWVDPESPHQSVLDPDIRWPKMVMHLPFAIVFTGVGLAAAWVFFALWTKRDDVVVAAAGGRTSQAGRRKSSASRQLVGTWFMAIFWCGLSFPVAVLFWMTGAPWIVRLMLLVFVAIGIGFLLYAIQQTRKARRYANADFQLDPVTPVAGQRFEVSLSTPAEDPGAGFAVALAPMKMRLAHYRVNDAGSGTSERRVEAFEADAAGIPDMQGNVRWLCHFELPEDAPIFGARRSGERVEWRLELLKEDGSVDVSFEVPVEGTAIPSAMPDRFAENLDFRAEYELSGGTDAALATPFGSSVAEMPPQVSLQETPDEWMLRFRQKPWRIAAWISLIPLLVLLGAWHEQAPLRPGLLDFFVSWLALLAGLILAFALHAASRRWELSVTDTLLVARKGSWIWHRTDVLPAKATDHLFFKLLFSSGGNASHPRKNYFGLYARAEDGGKPVLLTTGLPEKSGAEAVGAAIRQAQMHRAGRFSPGVAPDTVGPRRGAGWGWLMWAALMLLFYFGRLSWLGQL